MSRLVLMLVLYYTYLVVFGALLLQLLVLILDHLAFLLELVAKKVL